MHLRGILKLVSNEKSAEKDSLNHSSFRLDIIRTLANFYYSLKPQIICLQEVPSLKDARKIANLVKMDVYYEPGKSNPKYGGAILIDSAYFSKRLSLANLSRGTFERGCLMVQVLNRNVYFTVCNLHLPSNIKRTPEEGSYVRVREIASAISFLPEIIVGDLNERPDGPVYQKLEKAGYIDTGGIQKRGEIPTCNNARIDYIWVHKKANLKLVEYRVLDQPKLSVFLARRIQAISDHFPIMATFIYN